MSASMKCVSIRLGLLYRYGQDDHLPDIDRSHPQEGVRTFPGLAYCHFHLESCRMLLEHHIRVPTLMSL